MSFASTSRSVASRSGEACSMGHSIAPVLRDHRVRSANGATARYVPAGAADGIRASSHA